ncbi:hypothetical protein ACHAWF_014864 [Thalassiosira exigua]
MGIASPARAAAVVLLAFAGVDVRAWSAVRASTAVRPRSSSSKLRSAPTSLHYRLGLDANVTVANELPLPLESLRFRANEAPSPPSLEEPKPVGQLDNDRGWAWMAAYWSVGLLAGKCLGYLPSWRTVARPFTRWHLGALLTTVAMTLRFFDVTATFGRKRCLKASSLMAALNGACETMLFLIAYDAGAVWLKNMIAPEPSSILSPALGFLVYSTYAALIHLFFWMPKALPRHTKVDAKPFVVRGLPEVTTMSVSWLVLYVATRDVGFVCALHALHNCYGGMSFGLQLPSWGGIKAKTGSRLAGAKA